MKYGFLSFMAVLCLLAALAALPALAAAGGSCGDGLAWTLDNNGTLTVTGQGDMTDWSSAEEVPWYPLQSSVANVVISSGVTSVGNCAFRGCAQLTAVQISEGVTLIGRNAFYDCALLTDVSLPESVTSVGRRARGDTRGPFNATVSLTNVSSVTGAVVILAEYTDSGALNGLNCMTAEYVSTGSTQGTLPLQSAIQTAKRQN